MNNFKVIEVKNNNNKKSRQARESNGLTSITDAGRSKLNESGVLAGWIGA